MTPAPFSAAAAIVAILALLHAGASAQAQLHEQHFGRYIVRANVVHTHTLPRQVLETHRLQAGDDRALLDVVVLKTRYPPPDPVRAYVLVTMREPTGYSREIEMRPIAANDRVSFVGIIPISAPRVPVDFKITVYPEDDTALTMEFSEILYRRKPQ